MSETAVAVTKFTECPFSRNMHLDLVAAGYESPTPIQAQSLRHALDGKDILGLAQTGTGKTAAFALPIIHRLSGKNDLGALILAPTRELVNQIVEVLHKLGRSSHLRIVSLVGGVKISRDHKALRLRPNVIVATPGRLIDHIEHRTLSLSGVGMLVVDEADRMHDMGFMPQIRKILAALPEDRQTLMFTATMPPDVEQVARRHMRNPVKVQVGAISKPVERAVQKMLHMEEPQKVPLLMDILNAETGRVLVFVRTKRRVDKLAKRMIDRNHSVTRLHGDRAQGQRDEAMSGFRNGKYRIMVATDIAARGLDVADIEHVVNFDFPRCPEDYVHRIGRTARLAATGKATSFVTPADREFVRDLEKHLGSKAAVVNAPRSEGHPDAAPLSRSTGERQGGYHGNRHGGQRPHGSSGPSHRSEGGEGSARRHSRSGSGSSGHGGHSGHSSRSGGSSSGSSSGNRFRGAPAAERGHSGNKPASRPSGRNRGY
jgi:ATP-dependent RNA helicase RhlE